MIEINHLTKFYGNVRGIEDLSLKVYDGEIFGFIGPNGAGKSTTIKCMMNLIHKDGGSIYMNGKFNDIDDVRLKENVAYLPSEVSYYDDLTVKQMLDYSASFYKRKTKDKRDALVRRFALDEKRKTRDLSLGNLKKLGIVLAFMHHPQIVILDEPTSGLDPIMQETFYQLLLEEKKKGTTIFYSTHILSEVKKVCDRVGIIKEGRLLKVESLSDMQKQQVILVTAESKDVKKIKSQISAHIIEESEYRIKFMYASDIRCLLQTLASMDIERLWIDEPSVEEMFLHYYQ